FGCGLFCLATNQIAQTGLSSLPPVIYYSEQLFSLGILKSFFTGLSGRRGTLIASLNRLPAFPYLLLAYQ
ncbi:hypothetical protein, partial [Aeromonas caviae]|uniref:hypothetical protein n=1 Tax=Aeromonas caviae TaxID=648 RepID=UPI002AB3B333